MAAAFPLPADLVEPEEQGDEREDDREVAGAACRRKRCGAGGRRRGEAPPAFCRGRFPGRRLELASLRRLALRPDLLVNVPGREVATHVPFAADEGAVVAVLGVGPPIRLFVADDGEAVLRFPAGTILIPPLTCREITVSRLLQAVNDGGGGYGEGRTREGRKGA